MSQGTEGLLAYSHDLLLVDLDGVVHIGGTAVDPAPATLRQLRQDGMPVCYVTNNASRSADHVARLLTSLDVPAQPGDVATSAQAAAGMLAERVPSGARVLVLGSSALADEVTSVGLDSIRDADQDPVAVVQGYSPEFGWRDLAEATVALSRGVLWVVTNTDRTLPSERGPLPGNGALVAALTVAVDKEPDLVAGKPEPGLFRTASARWEPQRPLVVGDRLDTDIEGATRAGYDSIFVLTGVGTAADLLAAEEARRPRYVGADLADLRKPYPAIEVSEDTARCREWTVWREPDTLRLTGDGAPIDALRALCAAAWSSRGSQATWSNGSELSLTAGSDEAMAAFELFELAGKRDF
ncbi:MAG: HAD-IIA family hydrolase [Micromonosporaceae bacterium]